MQSLAIIDLQERKSNFSLLNPNEIEMLIHELSHEWSVKRMNQIEKEFRFDTYLEGLTFAIQAALIGEQVNHHADIFLGYKFVRITVWTHNVSGLTKADFVLAAKIQTLANKQEKKD
jgi:4a-hydroxytetrahydrobiopterin dehydratase